MLNSNICGFEVVWRSIQGQCWLCGYIYTHAVDDISVITSASGMHQLIMKLFLLHLIFHQYMQYFLIIQAWIS